MKTLALYAFIMALSTCNKYDDTNAYYRLQVPPYTETGVNTFGCMENGAVWANFGDEYVPVKGSSKGQLDTNKVHSSIFFNNIDSIFSIGAEFTLSKNGTVLRDETMGFALPKKGNLKGTYKLTEAEFTFVYESTVTGIYYTSIARNPFTVMVKKDAIEGPKHIVSGTFNGTLYTYVQTDSVCVADGVFDTVVK